MSTDPRAVDPADGYPMNLPSLFPTIMRTGYYAAPRPL